ncbi:MAG: TraB/GumN family protein [Epsilonproteobacteria bacterium]|nr:TraB/GumN family protein [Campylobacterota bacterium]
MKLLKIIFTLISFTLLVLANGNLKEPFLWEVTKGEQHFYLFGTMHLLTPELQVLPSKLTDIINKSTYIYTEIPMSIQTQIKATNLVMRNDNKKLQDILPRKLYQQSEAYVKKINPQMSLSTFNKMKIWGLSSTLTSLKNHLKYPKLRAIDKVIYDYAKSRGKRVGGIERIEEQLGIMDRFSHEEQLIALESSLLYLNSKRDYTEELKQLYLNGDSKKLMDFINSTMFQIPKYKKLEEKFMQLLLYDRNIKMAKRIEYVVTEQPKEQFLFAFGVMHFLGMKSVVGYLKSYGYRVVRIN